MLMLCPKRALLYAVLLAALLDPISGRRRYHNRQFKSEQHGYPPSGGLSGQGAGSQGKSGSPPFVGSHGFVSYEKTYKNNYRYNPPQSLIYSPDRGRAPMHYPVYHGTPPNYIYKYKNSGSKYGTLLTGLALLNLGALGVAAYSHIKQNSRRTPQTDEVCKFEVIKDNGDREETKIDCQIISSFILHDEAQPRARIINTTTVVTVTNTIVLITPDWLGIMPDQSSRRTPATTTAVEVLYKMLPNGTLVPVNVTEDSGVSVKPGSTVAKSGVLTSSVVTTATKKNTLVNALDVKGKDIQLTPGMQCFVTRTSSIHNMRKNVPCGLLQTYAESSIKLAKSELSNESTIGSCRFYMLTIVTVIAVFCVT